ncbi:MAG: caspase family protein [Bacteroidales bacterium]|nr:caspase family protein [Candidatus Sodaliphilus limicaballi]
MKKILGLLLSIFILGAAQAQTIHWLTFIDTTDKNVGSCDVMGRNILYGHFINEVNASLAPMGYKVSTHDICGTALSPERCKKEVESLKVTSPDDIIVFYYIGHGVRAFQDETPYPQMWMGQVNPNKCIPLQWVFNQLKSKGARLNVTIGMCCNNEDYVSAKTHPTFSVNYASPQMSGKKIKLIQDLFLGAKGNVIATSASPKQTSGAYNIPWYNDNVLDIYTATLCDIFDELEKINTNSITWDVLLTAMSRKIDYMTDGEQTPIHNTFLASAAVPSEKTPEVPREETVKKAKDVENDEEVDDSNLKDSLSEIFTALVNPNNPIAKRVEFAKLFEKEFADKAVVRNISQDGNIVVDKEDPETFLGRLATTNRILYVEVVDIQLSENGIEKLYVREIHHKQ